MIDWRFARPRLFGEDRQPRASSARCSTSATRRRCAGALYYDYYKDAGANIEYSPDAIPFPGCTGTGTHAYKLQHVGSSWDASVSCSTTSLNWIPIASHTDDGSGPGGHWTTGTPDVEAFEHGVACGPGAVGRATCWRRETNMVETHSHFQWINAAGVAQNVPYARCRYDTSYRWNGQQTTTTRPITVGIVDQHQVHPAPPGNITGPNGNGCTSG